jgi:hypothetical protein
MSRPNSAALKSLRRAERILSQVENLRENMAEIMAEVISLEVAAPRIIALSRAGDMAAQSWRYSNDGGESIDELAARLGAWCNTLEGGQE